MNDADLLFGVVKQANQKNSRKRKVSIVDDISDITWLMHWFPQFTLDEVLDMNFRRFYALLKHAKADYLQAHLQELAGIAAIHGQKGEGKSYFKEMNDEIKRLRE